MWNFSSPAASGLAERVRFAWGHKRVAVPRWFSRRRARRPVVRAPLCLHGGRIAARRRYIRHVKLVGPLAALGAATLLVYLLKPVAPVLSLGVVYTLAVLATAVLWGLATAVVVSVASMVAFNYLFLPPVHTLTLADGRNWAALGVYVATGVVASELTTLARRRAAEAEQRERETALIADAAAALLQQAPLDEIRQRADEVFARADPAARGRFEAAFAALVEAEAVRRSDAIKTIVLHTVSHDF